MQPTIEAVHTYSGPAASSFGVYCAQLSGIPSQALERATQILALQQRGRPVPKAANSLQTARDDKNLNIVKQLVELDTDDHTGMQKFLSNLVSGETK